MRKPVYGFAEMRNQTSAFLIQKRSIGLQQNKQRKEMQRKESLKLNLNG